MATACCASALERDAFSSKCLEHDLFRKPVSTFRDHALSAAARPHALPVAGRAGARIGALPPLAFGGSAGHAAVLTPAYGAGLGDLALALGLGGGAQSRARALRMGGAGDDQSDNDHRGHSQQRSHAPGSPLLDTAASLMADPGGANDSRSASNDRLRRPSPFPPAGQKFTMPVDCKNFPEPFAERRVSRTNRGHNLVRGDGV
jgi:hypothetical protein